MSGVMASVDQRTQLAGRNRLELLMFRLSGSQLYGINVFKVKEVLQCPPLSTVPQSHPVVRGISNIRGHTISIMDLSMAIGGSPVTDIENAFVIISEYNRSIQGFLVKEVERIVNLNWKDMLPPPAGAAGASYLTAVTYVNEKMVEIIDVERVLAEVMGAKENVSQDILDSAELDPEIEKNLILVSDDSLVARKQVCRTIENELHLETVTTKDGKEAIDLLKSWADNNDPQLHRLAMIISDIEMPEMDGYTFTTEVRADERLKHLFIILHTSMSGVFNQTMVDRVGANKFIAKFEPDILAQAVIDTLKEVT
ncbi:MAG: chemotaxis protein CheV [Gammaproteobacteria bacterium]|jgi:two-component system chemotaxis response regulator CheV|nr:chemotaxis protein CheV [Gammaproteobacteria bacterium]MBT3723258.1 chemotaxis protein CheV [Gammaproteobacteria bacterium]MBT4077831.1 chemotaxis protein CheV [Gammaproteobacteria bacterium]MBT4196506.1 chemotaxis protein CheV [Gammaproteobacteria bacterium]MBT4450192.1 chemotaxis protein CheV [Gammaproteobacteria bacterium]